MNNLTQFLTRQPKPCPCRYEGEAACGGQIVHTFVGSPPDDIRAVYACELCGAVWDHEGQPLGKMEGDSDE